MKKKTIFTLLACGVAFSIFSQENGWQKPERLKLYPSSHGKEAVLTPDQEIRACEQHLAALDGKEVWIKQHPEELKKAIKNDWFIEAAKTREALITRIKELKK